MRKLLLIFLFSSLQLFGLNWEFSWERIDVNFNGVVYSDTAILCFGTGSMILRTYDYGYSWEQENVFDDSLDIENMLFTDDNFVGMLNKEYIVIGDRFGKNWHSFNTGLDNQQSFTVTNKSIYVLSNNVVYEYDNSYHLKNSIIIKDTNNFNELAIYQDKLLAGGANGILVIIEIDKNYEERIIDFKNFGSCSTCPSIKRLTIKENKVYLSFDGDVYESNNLEDWNLKATSINLFDIKKDTVFDVRTYGTSSMPSSLLELWKADSLKNKKVSNDWLQRNVDILAFTDFKFIDENIAFAVGRDKLIAKSSDGGINWNLISNYKPGGVSKLDDSILHSVQKQGRIYTTKNSGITWLPCLYKEPNVLKLSSIENAAFYSDGLGFVKYSSMYTDSLDLLVTYDFGNSFDFRKNVIINLYKSYQNYKIVRTKSGFNAIMPNQNKNYFSTVILELDTAFNYLKMFKIDSVHVLSPQFLNEQTLISVVRNYHWPYNLAYDFKDSSYFYISQSSDFGLSWENEVELNMGDTVLYPNITSFKNYYLIGGFHLYKEKRDTPNVNQLFLIDRTTKQRNRIFNDVLSDYFEVVELNDNLLVPGWERILYNENFSDNPFIWSHYLFNGKYFRKIYPLKDKLWAMVYDIKNKIDHYYHLKINSATDVTTQTETKTYLFSYPPYPIPANNRVMVDIFCDARYNIDDADIGIFNYAGIRLSDKNEVTIDRKNNYSGILTWDCSGYPPGVYFIVIRHGDASRLIPVVVGE